jgi:hypothetical protein
MMQRSTSPRARERFAARRRSSFRPFLEVLEDRTVPAPVPWVIDADPSGTVFNDTNANGKFDAGETPLAGWTVWLDLNHDGVLDPGDPVTTTDAAGHYAFDTTNVPPAITLSDGTKVDIVRVDLQVGSGGRWLNTTATGAEINRNATPNATGVDFGVTFQPTVGVGPLGPESLDNVTTAGQQGNTTDTSVTVSADTAGDYVVAWRTFVDGGTDTVFARVFNADGSARTGEISVGTTPGTGQVNHYYAMPKVAMAGNGDFAVVWQSPGGGGNATFVRTYQPDGTPTSATTPVVPVSQTVTTWPMGVAADAVGNFAVLCGTSTYKRSGPTYQVQRYTATGTATGSAISVVSPTLINGAVSIGMAGPGNFVVAWDDIIGNRGGGTTSVIDAQLYAANGHSSGRPITVATGAGSSSVAMNTNGRFVVAYKASGAGRLAQVYNADGTPASAAITYSAGGGEPAAVAMDGAGNASFAWTSLLAFTSPYSAYDTGQVRMARLTAAGVVEPETIVNTTTQGTHALPGLAATGNGMFVIDWQGYGPGDDMGIFSQRYSPLSPQLPVGGVAPGGEPAAAVLTPVELAPIAHEAAARWAATGLTTAKLGLLNRVQYTIEDLSGSGALGLTALNTPVVLLDATGDGWGWFIDPTPADDAEFRTPGQGPAAGKMDLLTVVAHELGHVLGLDDNHTAGDLMNEFLPLDVRRLPAPGDLGKPSTVVTGTSRYNLASHSTAVTLLTSVSRQDLGGLLAGPLSGPVSWPAPAGATASPALAPVQLPRSDAILPAPAGRPDELKRSSPSLAHATGLLDRLYETDLDWLSR